MSMENGDHNLSLDFSSETNSIIPEIDIHNPLMFISGAELLFVPVIQLSNLDSIILPPNSPIYEQIVDISASSSVDPVTGEAILQVINSAVVESVHSLRGFAASPEFEAKMDLAFGKNWDKDVNISWPAIRVISSSEIDGANGSFAEATQTVYLSEEFLAQNLENIGEVRNVWLEEFGHSIDSQINIVDAQGDEGKIFSAVVQGKDLDEVDIEVLKGENDRAFVEIDGETLEIEKNNDQWVYYTIQPEDSLSKIALKTTGNASNYRKIADKNGIINPNEIDAGDKILVPSNNSRGTNVEVVNRNNDQWVYYTIQPEDSLSKIALKTTGNASNYRKIADKNGIINPNEIDAGDKILVPRNNSTAANVEVGHRNNDQWVYYTIQPEDSLSKIALNTTGNASRYLDIAKYNDIDPEAILRPGRRILVPSNNSRGTNVEVVNRNNDDSEFDTIQPGDSLEVTTRNNDNVKPSLITTNNSKETTQQQSEPAGGSSDKKGVRISGSKGQEDEIIVNPSTVMHYNGAVVWVEETFKERSGQVSLYLYDKDGKVYNKVDNDKDIEGEKNTILVIHGWNHNTDAGNRIDNLSKKAAELYQDKGYQVLALDWSEHAKSDRPESIPFSVTRSITPVAKWTHNKLKDLGIKREHLTLFGHSLGSLVSSEIGRLFEKVKNIVALDPPIPSKSYDIDGNTDGKQRLSDFKDVAERSLSFVVKDSLNVLNGIVGSSDQSATAEDSLLINYTGHSWWDNFQPKAAEKEHIEVINVFKDALSKNFLTLENNLNLPPDLSNDNYNKFGMWSHKFFRPKHEGIVTANIQDGTIKKLDYKNSEGLTKEAWI